MLIEDGTQYTKDALDILIQHKAGLGLPNLMVQSLPEFVESIKTGGHGPPHIATA